MRTHRFGAGLLLAFVLVHGGGSGWGRDKAPPTVKDQLEWYKDKDGKVKSPSYLDWGDKKNWYIVGQGNVKAGSKYKLDTAVDPKMLVYEVENGKAVAGTEKTFLGSKDDYNKDNAYWVVNSKKQIDSEGKEVKDFAGLPGGKTYAVIMYIPLKDECGNPVTGTLEGSITIPATCPEPCPGSDAAAKTERVLWARSRRRGVRFHRVRL